MPAKLTKTTTSAATKATTEKPAVEAKEVTKKKKTYEPEDLIPCMSIASGGLYLTGERSGYLYTWADYGDVVEVEYRDLNFLIRGNRDMVYKPYIVVEDDDIVAQNPKLKALYDSMYSAKDLRAILKLPNAEMKSAITNLPTGAKEALKGMIATMIDEGTLDSVQKIQIIDEIFDTNLLLTLVQ